MVWDISKGNPLKSFSCELSKHRIKSCRYDSTTWYSCFLIQHSNDFRYSPRNKAGKFHLYSCCVPSKVVKNQSPKSYVQKSCRESWKILGRSSSLAGLGCAMAVRYFVTIVLFVCFSGCVVVAQMVFTLQ